MPPDRWEKLLAVFSAAVELPTAAQRERLLDEACAGDPGLRAEIDSLLAAHARDTDLGSAVPEAPRPAPPPDELAGESLGRYRLHYRIGSGGMADVYYAERSDGDIRQGAAVKILQRTRTRPDLLQRFRREQRILAALEHPGVCRLLDSGFTDDGRPFLVTEYLESAVALTEYCDAQRLTVEARVDLFIRVCEAVHAVHQNLVVHGDLKPSNILVTPAGQPKLVDFGIGRLLGDTGERITRATGALPRPLTPAYASPEQLRGASPSMASDVYTLGVLLYELLSGRLPHDMSSPDPTELLRQAERLPEPPSRAVDAVAAGSRGGGRERIARRLCGDLDTIVRRAMLAEPGARYSSAAALADDLRRHREHFPVQARPVTAWYRFGKLVRRNRLATAATAAGLVALLAFAVSVSVLNLRISDQAAALQAALDRARATADFMTGLFDETNPLKRVQPDTTAKELLDSGYEKLKADTELADVDRAAVLTVIGGAYKSLGDFDTARAALEQAVALHRAQPGPGEGSARSLLELANLSYRLEDYAACEARAREALRHARQALPQDIELHSSIMNTLGLSLWRQHDNAEAERVLREAIALRRRLDAPESDTSLASNLQNLASVLQSEDRFEAALPLYAEALDILERVRGPEHPTVGFLLNGRAYIHFRRGDMDAARAEYQRAADIVEGALGPEHPFLGYAYFNLGDIEETAGNPAAARAAFTRALDNYRANLPARHPRVGAALVGLGRVALAAGDPDGAVEQLVQGIEILEGADTTQAEVLKARLVWLQALVARGEAARARQAFQPLARRAEELLTPDDPAWRRVEALSRALGVG